MVHRIQTKIKPKAILMLIRILNQIGLIKTYSFQLELSLMREIIYVEKEKKTVKFKDQSLNIKA